jgi:hypothetical protein
MKNKERWRPINATPTRPSGAQEDPKPVQGGVDGTLHFPVPSIDSIKPSLQFKKFGRVGLFLGILCFSIFSSEVYLFFP